MALEASLGRRPKSVGFDPTDYLVALHGTDESWSLLHLREFETRILNDLAAEGKIGAAELILYDLTRHVEWLDSGKISVSEVDFLASKQSDRGETVRVPLQYIRVLAHLFKKYVFADAGVSVGEAFRMEGGGQGKSKSGEAFKYVLRDVRLAREVVRYRAECEAASKPASLEAAFEEIAEKPPHGLPVVSSPTVKRAYEKYGDLVTRWETALTIEDRLDPNDFSASLREVMPVIKGKG